MNLYVKSQTYLCKQIKVSACLITNYPVSNEISDLLFFLSYFTSQNKKIQFGNYFFDVCCVN